MVSICVYYDLQLLFLVHVLPAQQIVGPEPPPGTTSEEEHNSCKDPSQTKPRHLLVVTFSLIPKPYNMQELTRASLQHS